MDMTGKEGAKAEVKAPNMWKTVVRRKGRRRPLWDERGPAASAPMRPPTVYTLETKAN